MSLGQKHGRVSRLGLSLMILPLTPPFHLAIAFPQVLEAAEQLPEFLQPLEDKAEIDFLT